ncbi:MAG: restriction endonuclease subunit S [Erysipelotrichales bacterium]|nr:restriction endonuclease subunit S [Erysipelotrichales bacterium]
MRSNYKVLGQYIQPVVGRNNTLGNLPLVGLSIQKKFISSIANTIGTDMSTYRIIEKNQFAYGPVTSRNGDKITIALFSDYEKALISQAYIPFEVKDKNELDPEYLMMWFCRPEFDRYARFKSHGSAREIFDWEEMCNVQLPIPSIEKQREIVKEYNTILNRITLNQQLIQKLESTAQAIYKEWFVDGIDKENLPEGWKIGKLDELKLSTLGGDWGKDISLDNYNQEVFCIRGTDIPTVNIGQIGTLPTRFILSKNLLNRKLNPFDIVIEISGGSPTQSTGRSFFVTSEYLDYIKKDIICSNFCRVIKAKENFSIYLFSYIKYLYNANILFAYENSSNGVKNLAIEDLFIEQIIPIPNDQILNKFNLIFLKYYKHIINLGKENEKLIELKELLLSKLAKLEELQKYE